MVTVAADQLAMMLLMAAPLAGQDQAPGKLACDAPPGARYHFGGVVGERVEANLHEWLLVMPDANPGMIEMFRVRDRQPAPDMIPWAGEFVGKYLISAVQAWRMTDDPALEATIRRILGELLATQDDGYLGPWPRNERLLGHWDLWGHYHVIEALLMWHEATGDQQAFEAAKQAGDLVCRTFLGTDKRVLGTGSPEMNMSILTALARLYRETGEERYLQMAREVLADWEQAGDYFRQGLAGVPFYRTPKPRWESLHDVQGLVELYRITGDARYREAFENLWRSIRAYDRHNTGGFSTGEQAVGDPYSPGAIETCCVVAWIATSVDMLQLTADPQVADEIERSTLNSILGAQHPSGRWCTYNTPMDGKRLASPHEIVFQARAGASELNCCSVNGPRGLGMLSEWAVLRDGAGLLVNYYGPSVITTSLADGSKVALRQETRYPSDGRVTLFVEPERPTEFALRLRVPGWSARTTAALNGKPVDTVGGVDGPDAGSYLLLRRRWVAGDKVELSFDFDLRVEPGDGACSGKMSLFRGPVLLAWDQRLNASDEPPTLDPTALDPMVREADGPPPRPWWLVDVGPADHRVTLSDFATAGAAGNPYRSWLPATALGPGPCYLTNPREGQRLAPGQVVFTWAPPGLPRPVPDQQTLRVSRHPDGSEPVLNSTVDMPFHVAELGPGAYYWTVTRRNAHGERVNEDGPGSFTVAADAPPQGVPVPQPLRLTDDAVAVDAPLDGDGAPAFGELLESRNLSPAADRGGHPGGAVQFNGADSKLVYRLGYFPPGDYSAVAWFRLDSYPDGRIAQVMSCWCNGGDDPLRITVDRRQVFARIEGGGFSGTQGYPLELDRWYHVAAVRRGGRLTLYVDGQTAGETGGPPVGPFTNSNVVGVGCNPLYTGGNECLPGSIDGFRLYARALTAEKVQRAFEQRD